MCIEAQLPSLAHFNQYPDYAVEQARQNQAELTACRSELAETKKQVEQLKAEKEELMRQNDDLQASCLTLRGELEAVQEKKQVVEERAAELISEWKATGSVQAPSEGQVSASPAQDPLLRLEESKQSKPVQVAQSIGPVQDISRQLSRQEERKTDSEPRLVRFTEESFQLFNFQSNGWSEAIKLKSNKWKVALGLRNSIRYDEGSRFAVVEETRIVVCGSES